MDQQQIFTALTHALDKIRPGTTWKHYKGAIYKVSGATFHTENQEVNILYRQLEDSNGDYNHYDIEFSRPLTMWFDDVEAQPGIFVPRFKRVSKVEVWQERS